MNYHARALYDAVQGGSHPADHRVPNPGLDVFDDLPGRFLEPAAIERFGRNPELDDQIV
jgi:hypothetical protein